MLMNEFGILPDSFFFHRYNITPPNSLFFELILFFFILQINYLGFDKIFFNMNI